MTGIAQFVPCTRHCSMARGQGGISVLAQCPDNHHLPLPRGERAAARAGGALSHLVVGTRQSGGHTGMGPSGYCGHLLSWSLPNPAPICMVVREGPGANGVAVSVGETEAWDPMTTIMDSLPSAQEPTDCPGCPIWLSLLQCLLCPCPHSYRTALCLQVGMGRAQHPSADGLGQAWAGLDAAWLACLSFSTGRSRRAVPEAH